jgi:divalent metal cation (Fe/Co/Zn/Cd) transporter
MPGRDSHKVLFAAIVANVAIAALKFAAAIVTRSSAMLAEAIHSVADTGNELLLLLGMHRMRTTFNSKYASKLNV